jgi:hypothetical protein
MIGAEQGTAGNILLGGSYGTGMEFICWRSLAERN